jgi:membrane-associated phospholipid phosphatase
LIEPLTPKPCFVDTVPRVTAGVDDAVPQQQLGHSVPAAHQICPRVLAGPDQAPGGFLLGAGNPDLDDLVHAQQPGQQQRFARVGLDPISGRSLPAVAGMTRMPYRRFVLANAAGGVLWATAVVVAGHIAGASWRRMQGYLGGASAVLLAIVLTVVVAVLLARWAVRHRWTVLRAWRRLLGGAIVATLRRRHARFFAFSAARLRQGTVAGLGLTVGLAVVGVLTALFAGLFDTVLEGDGIASLDRPVTAWLAAHRDTAMNLVMRAVTDVGSAAGLAAIAVAVAGAVAWRTRSWLPVSVMTATAAGSVTITVVGKYLVGRGRPALEFALTPATGYSFPSGHTTNSVAILGVGAWLLCRTTRSWRARVWITTGAVIGTSLVSFSRIYLGVHWLTDILASWLLAGTWLAVVITTMGVLAARRHDDTNADASGVGGRASPTRRPVHGAASGRGLAWPRPEHRTIQERTRTGQWPRWHSSDDG